MGRGCRAGGSCNGDDLEKAGSGGFNGVDSRKASSGGFLETAAKKKERMQKKEKKSGRKSTESSTYSVGLAWLMCIITDHYDYVPPLSSPHFLPSFFARVSHRHLTL
ncbi:hypothetical protein BJX66DRAFT_283930 [Aspergillus keveii]|uniref:Uncharacterized protein n=1 Tax=Aspergillus keveii TaxID=714993 RepID=A0ABR4FVY8_9EURO